MPLPLAALIPALVFGAGAAGGVGAGIYQALTGRSMRRDESMDDIPSPTGSMLTEGLRQVEQFSQPIQNLYAGRPGSAARQFGDLALAPADILLNTLSFGTLDIPELSRQSDWTSPTEIAEYYAGAEPGSTPFYARIPLDIAGDLATNPLNLIAGGGTSAAKGVTQAASRAGALRGALSKAAGQLDDAVGVGASLADEQAAVLRALEQGAVSRQGARQLAEDVMERAGGSTDEVLRLISSGGEMAPQFRQGGWYAAGQQIAPEGAIGGTISRAYRGAVDAGERASNALLGRYAPPSDKFDSIRNAPDAVMAALRGATGNLRLGPMERTVLSSAVAEGGERTKQIIGGASEVFGDLTPEQGRAFMDSVQGLVGEPLAKAQPFVSVPEQAERFYGMLRANPALEDVADDLLRTKAEGLAQLNQRIWSDDLASGIIAQPRVYTTASGQTVPVGDLVDEYVKQADKVDAAGAALDKAIDEWADDLARAGLDPESVDAVIRSTPDQAAIRMIEEFPGFDQWAKDQGYELTEVADDLIPADYAPRIFTKLPPAMTEGGRGGGILPFSSRARTLREPEQLREFVAQEGVEMELDPLRAYTRRAESAGRATQSARVLRETLGKDFSLADSKSRSMMREVVEEVGKTDPDFAQALKVRYGGLGKRDPFTGRLADYNRVLKPALLYGIGIPMASTITRNRTGAFFQKASQNIQKPGFAGFGSEVVDGFRDLIQSFVGAFRGNAPGYDKIAKAVSVVDDAAEYSGRTAQGFDEAIEALASERGVSEIAPFLKEARSLGILDGFVDTEKLLETAARYKSQGNKLQSFMDFPSRWFGGVEQRMRLDTFIGLREQGVSPEEAARLVSDAFLDYSMWSRSERAVRDVIPFAAFSMRTIPQQGRWLVEQPVPRSIMASLFGREDQRVSPPWVEDQPSFMLSATGDTITDVAGLGLPAEVLGILPSGTDPQQVGDAVRMATAAQANPMLRTAYGLVTGRDPFFDTKYGTYDKVPELAQMLGAPESGTAGRWYQTAKSTGMTSLIPGAKAIDIAERALDDRNPVPARLLSLLTGARIVTTDENQNISRMLSDLAAEDPRIKSISIPYTSDDADEDVNALIRALRRAQRQ